MKLSQLFLGETVHGENTVRPQQSPAQTANMNRQIRSLVPGQTISGEVLSKNGGEVQIKISEDMVLNARVDRNMNIEVGKNMTFEVKNNGSSLTLSPLFTNVSTDVNVLKALDMAGLPVNGTSVSMTEQMMQAGLPVNKNILQQIFREINSFPQGEISDIINLHRLQLPVNETNVEQMIAYRNLNHQLTEGMESILEALPEVFDSMVEEGNLPGAMRLYREVLELVSESGIDSVLPGEEAAAEYQDAEQIFIEEENLMEKENFSGGGKTSDVQTFLEGKGSFEDVLMANPAEHPEGGRGNFLAGGSGILGAASVNGDLESGISLSEASGKALADQVLELLDNLELPKQAAEEIRTMTSEFIRGEAGTQTLFSALAAAAGHARTSEGAMQLLEKLFSGQEFKELLTAQFKNSWMLRGEDVAVPGKVEEMYRRLDRQLKGLSQALDNAGQTDSAAYKAATAMNHNVDFLQQVNQMYTYVQLPLRLQHRDAHGELYVYTNKKKLSSKEGTISALLHLDMENLGPVDVYVTMQNSRVNTKFYLQDDEMIDFLAAHMDILTQRLQKRGYDCSFSMTTREKGGEEATEGGLAPLLGQGKGIALSQYAFDVRT